MLTAWGACDPGESPTHCGGGAGGALAAKFAETFRSELAVTPQPPLPEQVPPQPTKLELESGCALSETAVLVRTVMLQAVEGQSMPPGLEVTRPEPVPTQVTGPRAFSGGGGGGT